MKKPIQSLLALIVLFFILFSVLIGGVISKKTTFKPNFALDLEGGTEIVLTPMATDNRQITDKDIQQAITIIRQRIDSSGVSEAEITSQGGSNIVVGIPGNPSQETLDLVRRSAKMTFRTVLASEQINQNNSAESFNSRMYTVSKWNNPNKDQSSKTLLNKATGTDIVPTADSQKVASESDYQKLLNKAMSEKQTKTDGINKAYEAYNCDVAGTANSGVISNPNKPLITCDPSGQMKFILGPVMIDGGLIKSAQAGMEQNQWAVNLQFTNKGAIAKNGAKQFGIVTKKMATYKDKGGIDPNNVDENGTPQKTKPPQNQFAIVLDDQVISAPGVNDSIQNGSAQISGSFDQKSANTLANQLNFGALPLEFKVQSEDTVSATLGSEQLSKGLLAGIIGLIFVIIYSLLQYKVLGLVTFSSLGISGLLTYGSILLLSWLYGYRLSLAGVTGIIVSIGITADSFIVFFERVKDEIRNGRDLSSAVDIGWNRGKRTILASDSVNFLGAMVLYFVSVGGVRGFAFTLGLTTIIDVLVVFLFTHPIITYLVKTKFFGSGHPISGLDPVKLGAIDALPYETRKENFIKNKKEGRSVSFIGLLKERQIGAGFKKENREKIAKNINTNDGLTIAERKNKQILNEKSVNVQSGKKKEKKKKRKVEWVVTDED